MPSRTKTQGQFRLETPAKITLRLHILSRRKDGYHELRLALAPVSLYDSLSFDLHAGAGISLSLQGGQPPKGDEGENLVLRAALAFQEALGERVSAAIHLAKRIPAGAGLGGGSGNAAGTLVALNRWYGNPLSPARLHGLAEALGADVPFFLDPRPAWAGGVGNLLRPLEGFPLLELLIVKPPLSIATGEAYALATPEAYPPGAATDAPPLATVEQVVAGLYNRFEAALFPHHPELAQIKARLLESGAMGALLSGSGSALFGVFEDAAARDAAASGIIAGEAGADWTVLPCRTLARHRYEWRFS